MRYLVNHYIRVGRVFVTEPALQALLLAALAVLGIGTVFYHYVEDWGWLDSVYFCAVTLTTIGYGDITPQTGAGKIFTIGYLFAGLGIIALFVTALARAPMLLDDVDESERRMRDVLHPMGPRQRQDEPPRGE